MKTKLMNGLFVVMILGSSVFAQEAEPRPNKNCPAVTPPGFICTPSGLIQAPPSVVEKITKDGHYFFSFDDPANQWRCFMTSNAKLGQPSHYSFTVVCVRRDDSYIVDDRAAARAVPKGKGE